MASKNHSERRKITEMQIKINELQRNNKSLEQRILQLQESKEATSNEVDVLTQKNEQLCKELTEIDKLAEQLEKDKEQVLDAAEQELEDAKLEIRLKQKTIEDLEHTNRGLTLKQKLFENGDRAGKLMSHLVGARKGRRCNTTIYDKTGNLIHDEMGVNAVFADFFVTLYTTQTDSTDRQVENYLAGVHLLSLSVDQRRMLDSPILLGDVVAAIDSLPTDKSPGGDGPPAEWYKKYVDVLALQLLNTMYEALEDADFTKGQLEEAETSLEEKQEEIKTLNVLIDQLQADKSRLCKKVEKLEKSEKNSVLTKEKSKVMNPSKLDSFVKSLEEERDHYKKETECLRKMLRGRSLSPKRSSAQFDSELKKTVRERDEFQAMLEKYERHMAEIQGNVKVLTSERDKTNILYQQAQQEITQLRRELLKSPKTPKSSQTAQTILRRVEMERDTAISDFRRMTTERDSLRERLKISQETAISDRAHLEQRLEEAQSTIQLMENECTQNKSKLSVMKETTSSLENEMKMLTKRVMDSEIELSRQKSECDSLRLFNDKAENTLKETQRSLSLKLHELQMAQEKIERLEEKYAEQSSQSLSQREEMTILKATISEMDKEKDALIYSVDQKTETISSLEDSISIKDSTIQSLRDVLSEMEDSARHSTKTLSNQEQEISKLCRQLDEVNDELSRTGRDREIVVQENSSLCEKLSKSEVEIRGVEKCRLFSGAIQTLLDKEFLEPVQALNHKLKDLQTELEDTKLKLQGAMTDVTRLENSVTSKEKESRDFLENYRRASGQAENWEKKFHQMESEYSSVKLQYLDADTERRRLKDRVDSLERENDKISTSEESYKAQVSSLTKAVARLEEELRQSKAEKMSALSDLASTRELCVKLDSSKDTINRQLCTRNQEMERLQDDLESSCSEIELLRKQLASERITTKNLESMLISNQEKEFKCKVQTQELDSELQFLGDKLVLAENKLGTQSREAAQLKNKIREQEAELEIIKRQLSTERFERQVERAVKELRSQNYYKTSPSFRKSLSPARYSPDSSFQAPGHSFLSSERMSRSPTRSWDRSAIARDF
ncbi:testis-specific gene 10 protein [Rhinophrynus dorsalis]